jgi:hypothetical protein
MAAAIRKAARDEDSAMLKRFSGVISSPLLRSIAMLNKVRPQKE